MSTPNEHGVYVDCIRQEISLGSRLRATVYLAVDDNDGLWRWGASVGWLYGACTGRGFLPWADDMGYSSQADADQEAREYILDFIVKTGDDMRSSFDDKVISQAQQLASKRLMPQQARLAL